MAPSNYITAETVEEAGLVDGEYYRSHLPVLIDTAQAAEIMSVNPRTVTRMCADGQIKAVKVRGTWRVNRDALLAFCGLV